MENNELNVKSLPYGDYEVSEFVLSHELKVYDDTLKEQMKDVPAFEEIVKVAEKDGYVPFMAITAKTGIWRVEYMFGTSMYFALDSCTVDENNALDDDSLAFVSVLAHHLFAMTTIVGDVEYYKNIDNIIADWMGRMAENAENEEESKN